jgi:phosphatidylserine decarboxylase
MSIAKEGYPFILPILALGIVALAFRWYGVGIAILGLSAFVTFFFRDPDRIFAGTANQIASPADGKIVSIRKVDDSEAISIFLSVFDVHINRAPTSGKITEIEYRKGKFLAAFGEKASVENEQNVITMNHEGQAVMFSQIAGVVARRIVCWRKPGEELKVGDRIGLIKFGSRVDIFLPAGSKILIKKGQKVKGGETVIGELP